MALTAAQLKQRIAELLEVSRKEADDILWAFSEVMSETVEKADSVTIPGIGKLDCIVQPSRNARNPATGETIRTKPKVAVKFRVSKTLKDKAPSLTSKKGKQLLAAAQEKQAEREAAKAKRDRAAAKEARKGTALRSTKSTKKSGTKKVKARF